MFLEARDTLLRLRDDPTAARFSMRWPRFDTFNWAHDYFDVIAAGNECPALRVVDDEGADEEGRGESLAARNPHEYWETDFAAERS